MSSSIQDSSRSTRPSMRLVVSSIQCQQQYCTTWNSSFASFSVADQQAHTSDHIKAGALALCNRQYAIKPRKISHGLAQCMRKMICNASVQASRGSAGNSGQKCVLVGSCAFRKVSLGDTDDTTAGRYRSIADGRPIADLCSSTWQHATCGRQKVHWDQHGLQPTDQSRQGG